MELLQTAVQSPGILPRGPKLAGNMAPCGFSLPACGRQTARIRDRVLSHDNARRDATMIVVQRAILAMPFSDVARAHIDRRLRYHMFRLAGGVPRSRTQGGSDTVPLIAGRRGAYADPAVGEAENSVKALVVGASPKSMLHRLFQRYRGKPAGIQAQDHSPLRSHRSHACAVWKGSADASTYQYS